MIVKLLLVGVFWVCSGLASAEEKIQTINIVTESWENYTEEDGSSVFFDIVREIYSPSGIQLKIDFVPYARVLALLKSRQADAMFGTYSTEQEGKDYIFTPTSPIDTEETAVLFDTRRITDWKGVESLSKYHAAWVRGYDYQDALAVKPKRYTEVVDTGQGLAMLAERRFDMYMAHKLELINFIKASEFDMQHYDIKVVMVNNLYMALSKTEKAKRLASIYDQNFKALLSSGRIKALYAKYGIASPFKN